MKHPVLMRVLTITLILTLLASHVALLFPSAGVSEVHAAAPNINVVMGLFRSIAALNKRNRVYAEARATAAEVNAYYNAQIETARRLRAERISANISGDKSNLPIRAYLRLEASLEQERRAMIMLIEAEKNRARLEFNRSLANEIRRVLLASPGAQSVMNNVRDTIRNTRQAAAALQAAVSANTPTELLTEALGNRLGDSRAAQELAQVLGSQVGSKIDRASGGAITKIENAMADIKNELGQAIAALDDLDASIAQQQEQVRSPVSLVGNSQINSNITAINQNSVGLDVAAFAYTIAADRSGNIKPGETRQSMYDRIRSELQSFILSNTMETLLGEQVGELYCVVVDRSTYLDAAYKLDIDAQEPQNPGEARYLVCYDVVTNEPKVARLLESKFTAQPPAQPQAEAEQGAEPQQETEESAEHLQETEESEEIFETMEGEYQGTTNLCSWYVEFFGYGEVIEDEITLVIDKGAAVTGSMRCVWQDKGKPVDGCVTDITRTQTGILTGTVTENKGTVEIMLTEDNEFFRTGCPAGYEKISSEQTITAEFQINWGKISGSSAEGFTFEATKQ